MDSEKKPQKRVDAKQAARDYFKGGKTFKQALMDAGATETQARKGKALLVERPQLMKAFQKERTLQIRRLQILGQSMDAEGQADFVRGTLTDVAISGKGNERVAAASWLGKDRKTGFMFQPDNVVSLYQLQVPSEWADRYIATPTIDAIEVKDAVAQESLESLPKQDGMITLSSFSPCQLKSGKVEVPTTMPVEPEPMPVAVPAESIDQQYEIEVLTQRRKGQQ